MAIYSGRRGGGASLRVAFNGEDVSEASTLNFVSAADEISVARDSEDGSQVNVFHPAAEGAADWHRSNGSQGSGIVPSIGTTVRYIGTPASEGTPFVTDLWAASLRPTTRAGSLTFAPSGFIRFADNTSTSFRVRISQGDTELHNYVTGVITANNTYTTSAATFTISGMVLNGTGYMAKVSVAVPLSTLLPVGGKIKVELTHLNAGTNNVFTQEFFYDSESLVAAAGTPTLTLNTPALIVTSGVSHMGVSTTWDITIPNIDHAVADTAPPNILQLVTTALGVPTSNVPASDLASSVWNTTGQTYTETITTITPGLAVCDALGFSDTFYDWGTISQTASNNLNGLLLTKAGTTELSELFHNETYRVRVSDFGVWDSALTVGTSDAVVACGAVQRQTEDYRTYLPHNGSTITNPDYSASGSSLETYIRRFPDQNSSRQNGIFNFTGTIGASSTLEISINQVDWFDLKSPLLGGTLLDGDGCAINESVFPSISFTLTTHFTAGNLYLRVRLSGTDTLSQVTLTWVS